MLRVERTDAVMIPTLDRPKSVAHQALLPRALELAQAITQWDPELIATVKNVLDRGAQTTLEESGRIEETALAERKARGGMQWRGRSED